jgi:hypothetical protein
MKIPQFRLWFLTVNLLTLLVFFSPVAIAELSHEQVAAIKSSCGLVVTQEGSATAFCISKGVYATCAHAVAGSGGVSIAVQNPNGEWRTMKGKRIAASEDEDVALIAVENDRAEPLRISKGGLFETQTVTAFGFPFGKELAEKPDAYPDISVQVGRITSLRKVDGKLSRIQVDADLHPGNSGGPVVDSNAQVIGMVFAGIEGTELKFAKPVEVLSKLLATPKTRIVSGDIDPAKGGQLAVEVDFPLPPQERASVVLVLDGKETIQLKPLDGSNRYEGTVPAASEKTDSLLQIKIDYPDGVIQGSTPDRDVRIGARAGRLRQLSRIEYGEKTTVTGTNGGTLEGALSGLEQLVILFSGQEVRPPLRNIRSIDITDVAAPVRRSYRVAISVAGKEVAALDGFLGTLVGAATVSANPTEPAVDPVAGKKEIRLPGTATDIIAADSGNLLVITLEDISKVAIFDNRTLTIRGYLPLASAPAVVAANADTVFIYYASSNTLMSYRLANLSRLSSVESPFPDTILSMAAGCASHGPLLVIFKNSQAATKGDFGLLDSRNLQRIQFSYSDESKRHPFMTGTSNHLRASADGRVFGNTKREVSPAGYSVLTLGRTVTPFYEHGDLGVVVPSWDGSFIYTRNGIYRKPFSPVFVDRSNNSWSSSYIPAHHPNYYLKVEVVEKRRARDNEVGPPVCTIFLAGSTAPLLTIGDDFEEMALDDSSRYNRDTITLDKRFHFIPALKRLVTLAGTNDRLFVRSCDMSARLKEKGVDFLYISTSPPSAKKGANYQLQLAAESRVGGVSFRLESGPERMTLTPDGILTWPVPANHPGSEFVIVSVKDRSGQEKMQTLAIHTD